MNNLRILIIENDYDHFLLLKERLGNYYCSNNIGKDISFLPKETNFENMYDCISNIIKENKPGDYFISIIDEVDLIIMDMELIDKKLKAGIVVYNYLSQSIFKDKMPPTLFISKFAEALRGLDLPPNTGWASKRIADEKLFGELAISDIYKKICSLQIRTVHG